VESRGSFGWGGKRKGEKKVSCSAEQRGGEVETELDPGEIFSLSLLLAWKQQVRESFMKSSSPISKPHAGERATHLHVVTPLTCTDLTAQLGDSVDSGWLRIRVLVVRTRGLFLCADQMWRSVGGNWVKHR
jgi:hypothetical protein